MFKMWVFILPHPLYAYLVTVQYIISKNCNKTMYTTKQIYNFKWRVKQVKDNILHNDFYI